MKAAKKASPGPATRQKQNQEARTQEAPTHEAPAEAAPPHKVPPRDSSRKEACGLKAKLLAELDEAHKGVVAIEEQEVRAAREDRISDLITLSVHATRERAKFERALLAIRDHTLVHGS